MHSKRGGEHGFVSRPAQAKRGKCGKRSVCPRVSEHESLRASYRARAAGASGAIPGGLALRLVIAEPIPAFARDSIKIVHDATRGHCELAHQTLGAEIGRASCRERV